MSTQHHPLSTPLSCGKSGILLDAGAGNRRGENISQGGSMPRTPLPPIADRVATQAVKGVLGVQVQKLIDSQVARATGPLMARIDELERRIAALEGGTPQPSRRAHRSEDI
jgi:hypothetical protein